MEMDAVEAVEAVVAAVTPKKSKFLTISVLISTYVGLLIYRAYRFNCNKVKMESLIIDAEAAAANQEVVTQGQTIMYSKHFTSLSDEKLDVQSDSKPETDQEDDDDDSPAECDQPFIQVH